MKTKIGENNYNSPEGGNVLSEKTSGENSKIGNSPSNKNVKKAAPKRGKLLQEKANKSATKEKPKANKNVPKKISKIIAEGDSSNAKFSEPKGDKSTSKIAGEISLDLEKKSAGCLEPYDSSILFFTDRHKDVVDDVVSCLKSNSPFCFLGSEIVPYHGYYKEIVIGHIKAKEKIELLYFDPKFGDDLSVIINKELECIDISLIGALNSSIRRKILIIDNEDFASDLDWELMDSLRLELKVANIGVFGAVPKALPGKVKATSVDSKFRVFCLPEINKNELKELDEYISKHSHKAKHLETLNGLLMKESEKGLSDKKSFSVERPGLWSRFRKYIAPK